MRDAIILVLAMIGLLTLLSLAGVVAGLVWLLRASREPEGIKVGVELPERVRSGESFTLVVTVTDAVGRERRIRNIDLHSALTEGLRFEESEPAATAVSLAPELWTITVDQPLAAGGAAAVSLKLRAGEAGVYRGDLDVIVDGAFRSKSTPLVVTVTPAL